MVRSIRRQRRSAKAVPHLWRVVSWPAFWLFGAWLSSCSPSPPAVPPRSVPPTSAKTATITSVDHNTARKYDACASVSCWREQAKKARQRGILDVSAAHFGRAYELEPRTDTLFSWVDALEAAGQLRLAHRILATEKSQAKARSEHAKLARIETRLRSLAPAGADRSIIPPAPSESLRTAYQTAAAGQIDQAITQLTTALNTAPEPYHFARLGDLLFKKGKPVEARQVWSQARVQFDERGAELKLTPVAIWTTYRALWRDEQLGLVREYRPLNRHSDAIGLLQLWSLADPHEPVGRLYFPTATKNAEFSDDRAQLIWGGRDGYVYIKDVLTGVDLKSFKVHKRAVGALTSTGSGQQLRILCAVGRKTKLFDAQGKLLQSFELKGTTPTITRVYTGEGSYHHNILKDSKSWPAALALGPNSRLVAIGGSDSKIRLFDRRTGRMKELAFKWFFRDRRMMGANPDLNEVVGLRFLDGTKQLLALYRHGQIIRWDTRTGTRLKYVDSLCTAAEATLVVNRFNEPGEPERPSKKSDLKRCGYAFASTIASDDSKVVTRADGIRIRDARSGKPLNMIVKRGYPGYPDYFIALSDRDQLAMGSLYGAVSIWEQTTGVKPFIQIASDRTVISPSLSHDGRLLRFEAANRNVIWDLVAGRELNTGLAAGEKLIALSGDGKQLVIRTKEGVELRERPSNKRLFHFPLSRSGIGAQFPTTGNRVLFEIRAHPNRRVFVRDLNRQANTTISAPNDSRHLLLSDDGRWVATTGHKQPLQIWDAGTGKLRHTLDQGVGHVAFDRRGKFVAWTVLERKRAQVFAKYLPLDGTAKAIADGPPFRGWPSSIAVSPDGQEILYVVQNSKAVRWRPPHGPRRIDQETEYISAKKARYATNGKAIFFEGYNHIDIRSNTESLQLLATLYSLHTGQWLVISDEGAVDGSPGAIYNTVTEVQTDAHTMVFDGRLGWDRMHVPGTYVRALAGEVVDAPLLLATTLPDE